jgi:hypothetical protein
MRNPLSTYVQGTQIVGAEVLNTSGELQRIFAGVPRQAVAAGASADLQVTVSEPFRPDRIVLSTAAQALDVTNVRIGTKSLNVTSNPLSGNCFSEQAVGTHLQGYTAQAGVGFVISVQNNTAGSITTGGGVIGPALN